MPRELPNGMNQDIVTPNTGNIWMWLCEIAVPNYSTIRKARNTKDVRYAGNKYEAFNMDIGEQAISSDGSIPRIVLRVSQEPAKVIEKIINDTQGGLGGTVRLIKVNSDYLTESIPALEADYDLLLSESDSEWVTFTLGLPNPLTQRIPLNSYSSSSCPEATPTKFKGPKCQYEGADMSCTGTLKDCRQKNNAENWGGEIGLDPNVTQV